MAPRNEKSLRIALVGAGIVGTALAQQLVPAGHRVTISNSRGRETLLEEANETGAEAMNIQPALSQADVVILAIPMMSVPRLRPILQAHLRPGTVVIDCGNYYPWRDGHIETIDEGMLESQWVAETLGFPVVKAFNNIISINIGPNARRKGAPDRSALPVASDKDEHKKIVMRLVETIGFDPYDAGSLRDSWRQQPGQPVYGTEPSLQMIPGLLQSARNLEEAGVRRDNDAALLAKLPADFSGQTLMRAARFMNGIDRWNLRSWVAMLHLALALAWSTISAVTSAKDKQQ